MKKTTAFQNSLIWFGAAVSLAEILTGTYFAPLGMGKGLLAIIVGIALWFLIKDKKEDVVSGTSLVQQIKSVLLPWRPRR